MTISERFAAMAARGRAARLAVERAGPEARSAALKAGAAAIRARADAILSVNAKETQAARTRGESAAFIDRLTLDADRLEAIAAGVEAIAALPDPVGAERRRWTRPNGLEMVEVSVPIGLIGVIFESRPNVTADAAALCLRAGNAVILRGGSETAGSSTALVSALREGLEAAGLPADAIQTPPDADRDWVTAMLSLDEGGCDLVIPRGGKSLVAHVRAYARTPVLSHLDGVCHVYVHERADPEKALRIVLDSKMRRTGVCNAAETLLIDAACAPALLPVIAGALAGAGCALRGDDAARTLVPGMKAADEADWATEYLDAILAVRVVEGLDAALAHIAAYGSGHTDAIITQDEAAARRFLHEADSAVVLHNAATGFSDGGEFGFGGEIGIATGRLHARGPVGAAQLTTHKYIVLGHGQVRGSWPD
ncbi:glutamate-5-semialdehyde dehydrogenase [Alkalicaulis satelles]|uniref:Gamma-glutamyl phosphate reductase n=1 Tax=Alkalicaulis satelles TaxID=2609175 RepID=A0A5M6ZFU5_9PROT|nr:glutamate-5-semialdehyde dehydrogenase [Alkalicaulis satelles]KAA5803599.1 glutamate-5-semialdehyde dehydrogenase [Alkalicaulis satelles]